MYGEHSQGYLVVKPFVFFVLKKHETALMGGLQFFIEIIYLSFVFSISSVINLKKSWGVAPVAAIIFAMLLVDGQRGCSYLEIRLLLLKVVGSNPLRLASPEQDKPCSVANNSMACHI